jgi:hypothetical protein
MTQKRTICLFGTSGDPPTGLSGHVGIVKALQHHQDPCFDEIRVIPVYRHPYVV